MFWDFDKSPYIKEKLLHGQRIGRYHALDCQHRISYWKEFFGTELRIGEVTRKHIRDFSLWIAEKQVGGNRERSSRKSFPRSGFRMQQSTVS
jgi:hypothetical protein